MACQFIPRQDAFRVTNGLIAAALCGARTIPTVGFGERIKRIKCTSATAMIIDPHQRRTCWDCAITDATFHYSIQSAILKDRSQKGF